MTKNRGFSAALPISFTLAIFLLLGAVSPVMAQFSPPLSAPLGSVYGPRYGCPSKQNPPCPPSDLYQFHKGIDYAAPLGTPFNPVSAGQITYLNTGGTGEWFISIEGPGSTTFQYLHIFDDSSKNKSLAALPEDPDGNTIYAGCLARTAPTNGVCTSGTYTLDLLSASDSAGNNCFAIVFWSPDISTGKVDHALSPCTGQSIGDKSTTNMVTPTDVLALVGNSGGVPAHLHLQANFGNNSAFYYVNHDAGDYTVTISKDKGSIPASEAAIVANKQPLLSGSTPSLLDLNMDFPLTLNGEINYGIAGNDLDDAQIFWNRSETSTSVPLNDFNYGGALGPRTVPKFTAPEKVPMIQAIQQGVFAQPTPGAQHGIVDFLSNPIQTSQVWPGNYDITVQATSVLGQQQPAQKVTVQIAPLVGIWSGTGTFIDPFGDIETVQADATVTQQGDSITVTLVVTDGEEMNSYTETGRISSTGPNFSITTVIPSTGETVSITAGSFGNGGLTMSGTASVTDSSGDTGSGTGTSTLSTDGKTINGNAKSSGGDQILWTMTKQS